MYRTVEEAFRTQELICVMLNDEDDLYLVGIIEGYDKDGVLLYNIDYRGVANAHIYLATEKVQCIMIKPAYLRKIAILMNHFKNEKIIRKIGYVENLKEQILRWAYLYQKRLEIRMPDEVMKGNVCKISSETIDISIVDNITEEPDGHMIFSLTELRYICVEDDIEIEKIL